MEGRATQGEGLRESCSPGDGCASRPSHRVTRTPTPTPPHTHQERNWETGGRCRFQGQGFQSKGEDTQGWEARRAERAGSIQRWGSGPLLPTFNFSGPALPAPHHEDTMWPLAAAISFLTVAWSGGKNAQRGGGGGVAAANRGRRWEARGAAGSAPSPLRGWVPRARFPRVPA